MDIQLIINAPGNANGSRAASGDAKSPGDEFARHLAGASQTRGEGAGRTDGASSPASIG